MNLEVKVTVTIQIDIGDIISWNDLTLVSTDEEICKAIKDYRECVLEYPEDEYFTDEYLPQVMDEIKLHLEGVQTVMEGF